MPVTDFVDSVAFYRLGSPTQYSYNGAVDRASETCLMFLYEDQNKCGDFSLFVVMDAADLTDGEADLTFSGDFSNPEVADDPSGGVDTYIYNSTTDETNVHWEWGDKYTDGLAQSVPLNAVGDSIYVKFGDSLNIDYWKFVSGPDRTGTTPIDLNLAVTLNLTRVACS